MKMLGKTSAGTRPPDMINYAKRQSSNPLPRSMFNFTHTRKQTMDASMLVPFLCMEVVPGDTVNCETTIFARFNTLQKPVMDNSYIETHYWAVRCKNIYSKWKNMWGHQNFRTIQPTDYVVPFIYCETTDTDPFTQIHTLWDYLGIPLAINGDGTPMVVPRDVPLFSAMFSRAYNNIWNWRYRDENLQDSVFDPFQHNADDSDGVDKYGLYNLLPRGKRKDRFTSGLTSPQKFGSLGISLFGTARINSDGTPPTFINDGYPGDFPFSAGNPSAGRSADIVSNFSLPNAVPGVPNVYTFGSNTGLVADLNNVSVFDIIDFRTIAVGQQLLEILNINGSRYDEMLSSLYGCFEEEESLMIPEYLGGGRSNINISVIPQTSETTTNSPQGSLTAFGVATGGLDDKHNFVKSFKDHYIILGLVSVRTDMTYQQGLDPMFSRRVATDYMIPMFQGIGYEAIYNREIYYKFQGHNTTDTDNQAFGYQQRYSSYRSKTSTVAGLFRSLAPNNLDEYHFAELFQSPPSLSEDFIRDASHIVIDRASAVPNEPQLTVDFYIKCYVARELSTGSSVPKISNV